jgi:hypothetical protein
MRATDYAHLILLRNKHLFNIHDYKFGVVTKIVSERNKL